MAVMEIGRVIRAHSNLYSVDRAGREFQCKPRGRFRLGGYRLAVGDQVRFSPISESEGVIEDILPRQTFLERPLVANVDQALVVFTATTPPLDLLLVDRFLIVAQRAGLRPALCLNKVDQLDPDDVEAILRPYRRAGFVAVGVSAKRDMGLDELRAALRDRVTVFAGLSGVGKSSLANALLPGLELRTGELSQRVGRGRHTTRNVQLLPLPGGCFVADTPGFTSLELAGMLREDLKALYPEFAEFEADCRFANCLHWREPVCGVKTAYEGGQLDAGRYERYVTILEQVAATERRY
ncbi:MAG: ribosome small subunit-dependent GTPase A [Chloroflexota bacterium]